MNVGKAKREVEVIDGKKRCRCCNMYKDISLFSKRVMSAYENFQSYCKVCRVGIMAIYQRFKKMEFVIAYGGCCQCCGEKEIDLLTVEHIRDEGHKLIYDNNITLINKLKEQGWPKGYKCLCYNCNMVTRFYMPCPHNKKEYEEYLSSIESYLVISMNKNRYFMLKQKLEKGG